jgi:hypothetical protein
VIIKAGHILSYNFECLELKLWAFGYGSNFKTYLINFGLYKSPKIPTNDLHHANNETFNYKYDLALQEIMVYFIRKLNQELVILAFGQFGQFDHLVILDKLIIEHVQLDLWFFLLTTKWFFWLVKLDKHLANQKKIIKIILQFVNIKM